MTEQAQSPSVIDIDPARSPEAGEISFDSIVGVVGEYYGFESEQLLGSSNNDWDLADAQAIMFSVAADRLPLSVHRIAQAGNHYSGTVGKMIKRVQEQASRDPKLAAHLDELGRAAAGEPLHQTVAGWQELVAQHYERSVEEIATQRDHRSLEARSVMAHVLTEKTVLRKAAIAARVGFSHRDKVSRSIRQVADRKAESSRFAGELAQLEAGQVPQTLRESDVLNRAARQAGISQEELTGNSKKKEYTGPRLMAMQVLTSELGYSYRAAGSLFGGGHNARDRVLEFEKRLAADPRLQKQRADLLDPDNALERQQTISRLANRVSKFYDSDRFLRPRQVTAYLMVESLGLSAQEAAKRLGSSKDSIKTACRRIGREAEQNPLLAEELKYLEVPRRITKSMNERIIARTTEATGLSAEEIMSATTPLGKYGRRLAMTVMAERGHLSPREVGEFFGLASGSSVYRAEDLIGYQLAGNPVLQAQMAWVRERIFSEKPARFEFEDAAPKVAVAEPAFPNIDRRLILPETVEQIHAIFQDTAEFYGPPMTEVVGRSIDALAQRARLAAVVRCHEAGFTPREIALCLDYRTPGAVYGLLRSAQSHIEYHSVFAEELKDMAKGKERRDMLAITFQGIASYYGLKTPEMRSSREAWPRRGRSLFATVMREQAYSVDAHIAEFIGQNVSSVRESIHSIQNRLATDARLRAEVRYFANPRSNPRPPGFRQVLNTIRQSLEVPAARLRRPESDHERHAQHLAAFILSDELVMPKVKIAQVLQLTPDSVKRKLLKAQRQLAEDPAFILEIDKLRPPNSVSRTVAQKLTDSVARRYKMTVEDLTSRDSTNELKAARKDLGHLLVRYAGYSPSQVIQFFEAPA